MVVSLRWQAEGQQNQSPALLVENPAQLKPLLNPASWKLYQEMAKAEQYPASVAKKLNMSTQKAYYYINQLKKAGLIEQTRTEEHQGGVAKYYKAKAQALAILPQTSGVGPALSDTLEGVAAPLSSEATAFFKPFIHNETLDCVVAVGSPDAHGPHKARARDAHLAAELAAALGVMAKKAHFPLVRLDVSLPSLTELDANLVVVGGPITNRLASEVNPHLSIKFSQETGDWGIQSTASGKTYTEDNVGVVEKITHPHFASKSILFVAGKRNAGTRAAILALSGRREELFQGNSFDKNLQAKVVEGLDLDSDGKIDHVEVRE